MLTAENISVAYQGAVVVHGVSFHLAPGRIGCLLGPSGCGKTTVLRSIAGFEPLSQGRIMIEGAEVSRHGRMLPPEKRSVGMVFQDFALFPHLSVADNIAFGIRRWPGRERESRIHSLLELVGLPGYAKYYPHQLSGGQQQRIALARALAPKPKLLLLDEPFASLDVEIRESLAREMRKILSQEGITAILVTHDQLEAFAFADEIGVINQGRLIQWDSGYNLYHEPANCFVAKFIGMGVFLPGRVLSDELIETELGPIQGPLPHPWAHGTAVDVLIRPDDVIHDDNSGMLCEVVEKAFRGAVFLYKLRLPSGSEIHCFAPSHHNHAIGEKIGIVLTADHLVAFQHGEG